MHPVQVSAVIFVSFDVVKHQSVPAFNLRNLLVQTVSLRIELLYLSLLQINFLFCNSEHLTRLDYKILLIVDPVLVIFQLVEDVLDVNLGHLVSLL